MDDVEALAERLRSQAREDPHGRAAHLFLQDGPLRQSLIALAGGSALDEHVAPPAASLYVLRGRVRLTADSGDLELRAGQLARVPQERHGLTAVDDAVVLLTAVTSVDGIDRTTGGERTG